MNFIEAVQHHVAQLLKRIHISANMVTFIGLITGFFYLLNAALGFWTLALIMISISFLCDGIDGSLAKLENKVSKYGEVLDTVCDRWVDFFSISGIVIHFMNNKIIVISGVFAVFGSLVFSYVSLLMRSHNFQSKKKIYFHRSHRCLIIYITIFWIWINEKWIHLSNDIVPQFSLICIGLFSSIFSILATLGLLQQLKRQQKNP